MINLYILFRTLAFITAQTRDDGENPVLYNPHEPALTMAEFDSNSVQLDPEASMTMYEIIRYHGYPVEDYEVQTDDGYLITIQRIPHGKNNTATGPKKPVIIQHGLLASAAVWVSNTPDKNLAYILAEEGYDVWLTNVRGNDFGRKHISLTPEDRKFWNFSWDEMARFDMPAMIDFILNKTGYSQLIYVGHSMGTTLGFAMLASRPEYNAKVKAMMAMAPAVFVGNIRSPVKYLVPYAYDAELILTLFGKGEFLPNNNIIRFLSITMCDSPIKILCSSVMFLLCGFDIVQLNQTRLPVYLHLTPAGTSVHTVLHFAQMVKSHKFGYYDHGPIINQKVYNQTTPPEYDLKNITAPVAIFWSQNDYLADPKDVADLATQLPNLAMKYKVPYEKFSHLDFMWAKDIKKLVYDKLVRTMKKFWRD